MPRPVPFLMYHELLAGGRSPARPGDGYGRYVITDATFRDHLEIIRAADGVGVAVGMALAARSTGLPVALTFDDGCASDLLVAAPVLIEFGFGATFFVTVAHLDSPGFLTRAQVRELADAGFEIGSHGMTHAYLSDLGADALRFELAESRSVLEDLSARPVVHLSCPGGRWNRTVADTARDCGYLSVCDSRPVGNTAATDAFRLGRFAITKATSAADVGCLARDGTLGSMRWRSLALGAARAVLGNRMYDRARTALLERGNASADSP